MSADDETILAYETRSHEYLERVGRAAQPGFVEFVASLPEGGHVLDLGCGPGDSAHRLQKLGFSVDAVDATPAMISRAAELGVTARQATFDEIDGQDVYDGIWANYSLLHAAREDFPIILAALHRALKPGGRLHIGMKLGTGQARDRIGRYYTYYSEPELVALLAAAGFTATAHETSHGIGQDDMPFEGIWIHANG